jgi:hypothetical protein
MKDSVKAFVGDWESNHPDGKVQMCRHIFDGDRIPSRGLSIGKGWTLLMCDACYGEIVLNMLDKYFTHNSIVKLIMENDENNKARISSSED